MAKAPAILAITLLAACASPQRWEHGTLGPDRWKADEATCRAEAAREVDHDAASEQGYGATARESRGLPVRAQMAAFEAIKKTRLLVERCMKNNGYVQAGE